MYKQTKKNLVFRMKKNIQRKKSVVKNFVWYHFIIRFYSDWIEDEVNDRIQDIGYSFNNYEWNDLD